MANNIIGELVLDLSKKLKDCHAFKNQIETATKDIINLNSLPDVIKNTVVASKHQCDACYQWVIYYCSTLLKNGNE